MMHRQTQTLINFAQSKRTHGAGHRHHVAFGLLGVCSFLLLSQPVHACGGLFCNANSGVNQTAERIVFAQDDAGNVTQIVEILYEGEADEFAWLLPVPGTPTPGVSSTQALDQLQQLTNPLYSVSPLTFENCGSSTTGGTTATTATTAAGTSGDTGFGEGDGNFDGEDVLVLDSGQVGEFVYDTISVVDPDDPGQAALDWLNDNEYDVGDIGKSVLEPYLANGLNLIAFKLQKNATEGAIVPISLQVVAEDNFQVGMTVPIRPTAVAANDDMPILIWVLGKHRAIPTNYYSLELNEMLIDWFNPNQNYNQVVSMAANSAGGQGFATEYASRAPLVDPVGYDQAMEVLNRATERSSGEDLIVELVEMFRQFDGMLTLVTETVELREGVSHKMFIESPYCYFNFDSASADFCADYVTETDDWGRPLNDPIYELDIDAFSADIESRVIGPLEELDDLIGELPYITRLYTTMSADEMSKDPAFDFNTELEEFSNVHQAPGHRYCNGSFKVTIGDEEVYGANFGVWPYEPGASGLPENARVLQHHVGNEPDIIDDFRSTIAELNAAHTKMLAPTIDAGRANSASTGDEDESKYAGANRAGGCVMHEPSGASSPWWLWLGLSATLFARWGIKRRAFVKNTTKSQPDTTTSQP